jgi:hypothetical protein
MTAADQGHVAQAASKDERLAQLADDANVAQFVSFSPGTPVSRFSRLRSFAPDARPETVEAGINALLMRSASGSVNVRTFLPDRPGGQAFHYGITDVDQVAALVRRLARDGLYTIVNETVDVHDGGVSGVALGDVVEFAPDDTPRCVEESGTAALPRAEALTLLEAVYGFRPDLDYKPEQRVEFSLHPLAVGYRRTHTLIWEIEDVGFAELNRPVRWPNLFSRFLGDKTFGLLVADLLELPVPHTTVIARRVAPFTFGRPTGSAEYWLRTCPPEPVPGRFTTQRGWTDPFALLAAEDQKGDRIAAVLAQRSVRAQWSGALRSGASDPLTEGVSGFDDAFMQGVRPPEELPASVRGDLLDLACQARQALKAEIRLEWVHDGDRAWVVQLHVRTGAAQPATVVSGEPADWLRFHPSQGLDTLRALIDQAHRTGAGILVTGPVGLTSHVGDLLRAARVPSRLQS